MEAFLLILTLIVVGMAIGNPERWMPGNESNATQGADLASATTLTPTHRCHYITGTAAVDTITIPWVNFSGDLVLIAEGAWTWTTSGNIGQAGTAVAATAQIFQYSPTKGKWYPQSRT